MATILSEAAVPAKVRRCALRGIDCGLEVGDGLKDVAVEPAFWSLAKKLSMASRARSRREVGTSTADSQLASCDFRTLLCNADNSVGPIRRVREGLFPRVQRGNAEDMIKVHKVQLSSDRTSCRSDIANQLPLVLRAAA
jgi:hypothetical protein